MTVPAPSVPRDDLVRWLDAFLGRVPDRSMNGLQIEGRADVARVAVSVDANLRTIQDAADAGADFLIVHHGLFWGEPLALTGPHKKRVEAAFEAGLSLYASHLPLDVHPEVGNNAMLASALSLQHTAPFGTSKNLKIGVRGELPISMSLQDLADRLQRLTGEICLVHGGGPGEVRHVGIVSGAASDLVVEAAAEGLDTFITGEPKHQDFSLPFEYGVNSVYIGHYESETFGVRALAARLEEEFGLPWQFVHVPTGL